MRVGVKVGPFYVSSSTRRRRQRRPPSRPTPAQRAAQAAARAQRQRRLVAVRADRRARYGPPALADPRSWHTSHTVAAIVVLSLVIALPSILEDGPIEQNIWTIAVLAGVLGWVVRSAYRCHGGSL